MLKKSKNSDELKTHREMYVAHCAKCGGLELPAGIHYTAGWNDASEILDAVVSLCQESDAAAVKRADEIEQLKTELREISEAIDDPAINLTNTAVECINDLKKTAKTWINPNDKTQKQYLPHIGEQVLFCHKGKTYIGKHTGGSFKAMTPPFAHFGTWDCHWMYPPAAISNIEGVAA